MLRDPLVPGTLRLAQGIRASAFACVGRLGDLPIRRDNLIMNCLIKNGRIVDVAKSRILEADVLVRGGRIVRVGKGIRYAGKVMDAKGLFLVPGLIDSHAHFEMSMLSPAGFAELVVPTGTTSIVFDCHDLANVVGVQRAVRMSLQEFSATDLRAFGMVPVCVPSSEVLESSGARASHGGFVRCSQKKNILGIAEVMDVEGVFSGRRNLAQDVAYARARSMPIDGHCPGLGGRELSRYIRLSGASTDHEFSSVREGLEKARQGLKLILRRGVTKEPNAGRLWRGIADKSALMACTDGCTTPEFISENGYMDFAVRSLHSEGVPILDAIKMATVNVASHYGITGLGQIREGFFADICFVSDLEKFVVRQVMVSGRLVPKRLRYPRAQRSPALVHSLKRDKFAVRELETRPGRPGATRVRVVCISEGTLVTGQELHFLEADPFVRCEPSKDIAYLSVANRYHQKGRITNAFVKGFGLRSGALACSNAQDSQNMVIIGTNHQDMVVAANHVLALQGGCVLADRGRVVASLRLAVAGILTDESPAKVTTKCAVLEKALKSRGCGLEYPLFNSSMLFTISSIPHLKVTDKGLCDTDQARFVEVLA